MTFKSRSWTFHGALQLFMEPFSCSWTTFDVHGELTSWSNKIHIRDLHHRKPINSNFQAVWTSFLMLTLILHGVQKSSMNVSTSSSTLQQALLMFMAWFWVRRSKFISWTNFTFLASKAQKPLLNSFHVFWAQRTLTIKMNVQAQNHQRRRSNARSSLHRHVLSLTSMISCWGPKSQTWAWSSKRLHQLTFGLSASKIVHSSKIVQYNSWTLFDAKWVRRALKHVFSVPKASGSKNRPSSTFIVDETNFRFHVRNARHMQNCIKPEVMSQAYLCSEKMS